MQLKFIALSLGGVILSTNLVAFAAKNTPSSVIVNKTTKSNVNEDSSKIMPNVHNHGVVFDEATSGGLPYDHHPHATHK